MLPSFLPLCHRSYLSTGSLLPYWELATLLSEADRAVAELSGAGRLLPNPHLLIRPYLLTEMTSKKRNRLFYAHSVLGLTRLKLVHSIPPISSSNAPYTTKL